MNLISIFLLYVYLLPIVKSNIPKGKFASSLNFVSILANDGVRFTGRNGHASCVFKDKIWVTGGRSALYAMYNLQSAFENADVWHSDDGRKWVQITELYGDFYAQNDKVKQPGSIAPFYERFGHTMNALDIDGDEVEDVLILTGGYSPSPSNDIWISYDGITWSFCGLAPWSARAWHSARVLNNHLYIMGGSPLNNEVWRLDTVERVAREAPLTRAAYLDYSFNLTWTQLPNAPWAPRVGMGAVSQWFFDPSKGQTVDDGAERIVITGGYGGFLEDDERYDGFHTFNDVWDTYDGITWNLLIESSNFNPRAWHAITTSYLYGNKKLNSCVKSRDNPPKIYLFGGGTIGFNTTSSKRQTVMIGQVDSYFSYDGISWSKLNYDEGTLSTTATQYSSQEWTKATVNGQTVYIGLWGPTAETFAPFPRDSGSFTSMFVIGGFLTNGGGETNLVYQSQPGVYCDYKGSPCSGNGECGTNNTGCICQFNSRNGQPYYTGEYCQYRA